MEGIAYVFDGSFDGLLTAVFDSYNRKEVPEGLFTPNMQLPLTAEGIYEVISDDEKSNRVWRKLRKVLSPGARAALTAAFLTDSDEFPTLAMQFIRRAVVTPYSIERDFSDSAVLAVLKEAKRVRYEAHRLLQFMRFQKAKDGTYFAMMEPMFDVLPMVVNHFKDRFSDSSFIIYDRARDYGFHYDGREARKITLEGDGIHLQTGRLGEDIAATDEHLFQELWKAYYDAIAIKERLNPRKRRQDMPVRYWKYLTEMQ